jgi:arginine decarboxylase
MTQPQSPFDAIYNVQRWGDGYFRIGKDGHLHVRPQGDQGG